MLWIVPLAALVMCGVVFGYGFLGEGLSARVVRRSLTILDQRQGRATTLGILGLYSPITPPGGVGFDYDTELTSLGHLGSYLSDHRYLRRSERHYNRRVVVDWSNNQHYVAGGVEPRVPE